MFIKETIHTTIFLNENSLITSLHTREEVFLNVKVLVFKQTLTKDYKRQKIQT
jgi:hypothetical protein